MLSFFNKKPAAPPYADKVWVEKAYKYQGLFQALKSISGEGERSLVIAQSEATFQEAKFVLGQTDLTFATLEEGVPAEPPLVLLAYGRHLSESAKHSLKKLSETALFHFFVLEHAPTTAEDDALLLTLQGIDATDVPSFFLSLDDALFEAMGVERIKQIMVSLGVQKEEAISHKMISNAIRNAQEKLAKDGRR